MAATNDDGIVTIPSKYSVGATVERLKESLASRGVKVFAVIDHSGEAAAAGLKMPDTKLIIFGNPKAGTPLMLARPSIAIDLPLKILVAEDENGNVSVSYTTADFLSDRHQLPAELAGALSAPKMLAETVKR